MDLGNSSGLCDSDTVGAIGTYSGSDEEGKDIEIKDMFVMCLYNGKRTRGISKKLVFFHELGHVYDLAATFQKMRTKFRKINKLRGPWFSETFKGIPVSEYFADAFAWCAYKAPIEWIKKQKESNFWSYWPTRKQHKKVCKEVFNI